MRKNEWGPGFGYPPAVLAKYAPVWRGSPSHSPPVHFFSGERLVGPRLRAPHAFCTMDRAKAAATRRKRKNEWGPGFGYPPAVLAKYAPVWRGSPSRSPPIHFFLKSGRWSPAGGHPPAVLAQEHSGIFT